MMSGSDNRVVRQLQLRLQNGRAIDGLDVDSVVGELRRRVRRLQRLGREFSSVRVSPDVVRLCASKPALCAGSA